MFWQKKLAKILLSLLLLVALASCDGSGCVEAEEFNSTFIKVKSNPVDDGVTGNFYDDVTGGQVAEWHSTNFRTNQKPILVLITGGWVPWGGSGVNDVTLAAMPQCGFCAKRTNNPDENCVCYKKQNNLPATLRNTPMVENGIDGHPLSGVNCSIDADQNNPDKCSCTTLNGQATDYGLYHFPLNYYKKDGTIKLPDNQEDACKYSAGMGLYMGLFGASASQMPTRVYHLFSQEEICDITRDSNNRCIDETGKDRTKYLFRSKNAKPIVKDDLAGNDGTDTNPADDIYHGPNEFVKFIIYDRYYSDNYGEYNVSILSGAAEDGDTWLLEYLVSTIEEIVMGKKNAQGVREGGIIEFMYKAIVQDTYFIAALQICLAIYIAFYGAATLIGVAELNKKELLSRTIKIALIMMFTSPSSWYFFDNIIIGLFKDSMDFLIAMMTNFADDNLDLETSAVKIAQLSRQTDDGNASRFTYVDMLIKTLLSDGVTKKIWGLFFADIFGLLYIIALYVLIGYFIYVMFIAASVYVVTLIKLVFVLSLGPIFFVFTLFSQTKDMFKKWLAFLGARSLEMIMLFLILYTFVMLIDQQMAETFAFRACFEKFNLGLFSFTILKSYPDRSFVGWLHKLFNIAAFTFLFKMILDQIPTISSALVAIEGVKSSNSSSFALAANMVSSAASLAKSGVKRGLTEGSIAGATGLRELTRATGISAGMNKIGDKIPFRSPRTWLRDRIIDAAIQKGKNYAKQQGLKPGDANYDRVVRDYALNNQTDGLSRWKKEVDKEDSKGKAYVASNRLMNALYGMHRDQILKRFDEKLVKEPLRKFIKETAKKVKNGDPSQIPLGKDMQVHLKNEAREWAKKGLVGGVESIEKYLHDFKGLIKEKSLLTSKEAAKKFAHDEDMQKKYLQHLKKREVDRQDQKPGALSRFYHAIRRDKLNNPKNAQLNFMRKVRYEEGGKNNFLNFIGINSSKGFGVLNRVGFLDKIVNRDKFNDITDEAMARMARDYLTNGSTAAEKQRNKEYYDNKRNEKENATYGRLSKNKEEEKNKQIERYRAGMKEALMNDAKRKMQEEISGKTLDQIEELRRREQAKLDRLLDQQLLDYRKLASDPASMKDEIKKNGGIEAYRDGLIDKNGDTIFEAKARLSELSGKDQVDSKKSNEEKVKSSQSEIEKILLERAKLENGLNEDIKNNNLEGAKDKEQKLSVLLTESNIKAGQNVMDAIALQASNVSVGGAGIAALLPGADQSQDGNKTKANTTDMALVMHFEANKRYVEDRAKLADYQAQIKQIEISKLDSEKDIKAIQTLNDEIRELKSEQASLKQQADTIKNQIEQLRNV